jgi:hypothetical protein
MKFYSRRAAAVALAVALSVSTVVTGSPRQAERDRDKSTRIILLIKKVIGISTNDDMPAPPHPTSKP